MNRLLTLPFSERLLALPLLAAAGLVPASAAGLVPASAAAASRPPAKSRPAAKTISAHPVGRHAGVRFRQTIVGGTNAARSQWGFMAYVGYLDLSGSAFSCSGTVVASNVILTAGHCAVDRTTGARLRARDFGVVTSALDVSAQSSGQLNSVVKIIVDPAYDRATGASDAALLVLSKPIVAPTISLATGADRALVAPGAKASIAGWGETSAGSGGGASILQSASTEVQASPVCTHYYPDYNASVDVCTVHAPKYDTGTCHGDSGGPLVATTAGGGIVQIGVISAGPADCNPVAADLFTAVAPLADWANGAIRAVAPAARAARCRRTHRAGRRS